MQKRIGSVDLDTGELMEGAVLGMFFPKRQNGFREGWVAMSQQAMRALAVAQSDLTGRQLRVLLMVLGMLDMENFLLLSQAEIAKDLGLRPSHVSEAISRLVELGILIRGPKAGRSSTFRLNPRFGWKGSASNHNKALRERMQAAGLSVVKSDPVRDPRTIDAFTGKADIEGDQP